MTRGLITRCCRSSGPGWLLPAVEQVALDALLERLVSEGLVKAGGKQRTDSTHVVAAVAALNRLELAGEKRAGGAGSAGGRAPGLGGPAALRA